MPDISIIIPIIRIESAECCMAAIKKNAGIPIDYYEIVTEVDADRVGCPRMVKRLVKKAKGQCIMFLGDDTIPQKDFLKNALTAMELLPDGWGLVGLNDQQQNGNKLATHWLADKRLLSLLDDEFFHTGYWHTRCDNELTLRCQEMGKYIWAKDAIIEHRHPSFCHVSVDADYKRVYSQNYLEHDKKLFWKRSQNDWQTPGE